MTQQNPGWNRGGYRAPQPVRQAPSGQLTGAQGFAYPSVKQPDGSTGELVRVILASVAVGLLGFGLLVIIVVQSFTFNGLGALIVMLSLIPMALIFLVVLWFNRWQKRNLLWLFLPLLWGAVMAIVFTLIVQLIGISVSTVLLGARNSQSLYDLLYPVLGAPPIEEGAKGLYLVVFAIAARRQFSGPLDGFIYGSLAGAGFAFTENLQYLSGAFDEGQFAGLAITFVLRGIVSPLGHSLFTALAGVAIGLAVSRWPWWSAIFAWPVGWFAGAVFHGFWNLMASIVSGSILGLLIIVAIAMINTVIWYSMAFILRWLEARRAKGMLDEYRAAGWLTPPEVDMFGTWRGRRQTKRWAAAFPGAGDIVKKMVRTSIDLSNSRQRINIHAADRVEREREKKLLNKFTEQRSQLISTVNSYRPQYPAYGR